MRLKLTLFNPHTTPEDVAGLLGEVTRVGREAWLDRPAPPRTVDAWSARAGAVAAGRWFVVGAGSGWVRLKLILFNPHTTPEDVAGLLGEVTRVGREAWHTLR
ncbi:hypothetical protein ACFVVL_07245 [Kitasatospora sp. NPDC058115]|uniref:hypothetical protein n=1 Tax=Kitasatospora sp. NPDC058115 TaxID=3346347 RepID=UPI0036DB9B37